MKRYKQLVKELPSKKVVFVFGRFQPPTAGHEFLVNAVKKLAKQHSADHIIFVSATQNKKTDPLSAERKVHYLKKMFPGVNFVAAPDHVKNLPNAFVSISKKYGGYRDIIVVSGSDRLESNKNLIQKFNWENNLYDTAEAVSIGQRDPDADDVSGMSGTKMREAAVAGNFETFKKGMPSTMTEHDIRLLMNEVRQGMGKEPIKEQVVLERSELREKYFAKEIFNLDEIVECEGKVFRIAKRGSNHLLLEDEQGQFVSKWIQDVSYTEKEFTQGILAEMKFSSADKIKVARIIADTLGVEDAEKSSSPDLLVNMALRKIKSKPMRPEYVEVLHKMLDTAREAGIKVDDSLVPKKVTEQVTAQDVVNSTKKYTDRVNNVTSPERVNDSDQDQEEKDAASETGKHHTKPGHTMVHSGENETSRKMKVQYATEENDLSDACWKGYEAIGTKKKNGRTVPNCVPVKEESDDHEEDFEDMSDEDMDSMVDSIDDVEDVIHAYDDEELAIVDDEGNEVDKLHEETEQINEVLSRMERIRAKVRFARSAAKRERKIQIALRKRSDTKTLNKRARRLAVNLMKQRITKKDPSTLSVGEKERVERMIEKRKAAIGRLAMKLTPRLRKIEQERLSHKTYTK